MIENARLREAAMKTALYRELLGYVRLPETRALVARVLYRTEGLVGGGFVLDRGSRDSVVTGSVCIAAAGLVGIVDQVEDRTCTVLPITLPGVLVSAVCGESGAMGLVSSSADGRLGMSHVDQAVPPRAGEQVLTSRFGGVYPDGIVIGTVTAVGEGARGLDIALRIEPAVDFRRIGEVLILLPYHGTP
jgi:rod shape-determining protein MreC